MESKRFFVFFVALLDPQFEPKCCGDPLWYPELLHRHLATAVRICKWFRLKPRNFSLDEGQFLGHPRTSIPSLKEGTQFMLEATPKV